MPFRVLLASGLVIKILQRTLSNRAYSKSGVDYLAKGGKHGRRERTLVPSARSNFTRPTLVDRLAIYGRLCQSGLVADSAGDSNLAVLPGTGSGELTERALVQLSGKKINAAGFERAPKGLSISNEPQAC